MTDHAPLAAAALGISLRRPSPRMWRARRLLWALVCGPALMAATAVAWLAGGTVAGVAVLVVLLLASAAAWLVLRGRYRSWGYAERADDLVVTRGILVRRTTVVPYGRMQLVDVTAGPVDRMFGLATVTLHTAAAATDARVPGLDRDEAHRLRDQLAQLGEARAAGL